MLLILINTRKNTIQLIVLFSNQDIIELIVTGLT